METTYPLSFRRTNTFSPKPYLIIIVCIAAALCTHALLHNTAQAVKDRCDDVGPSLTLKNPATGHILMLCQMEDGKDSYGRIFEQSDENGFSKNLTAFLNSAARKNTLRKALMNVYKSYTEIVQSKPEALEAYNQIIAELKWSVP